MNVIHGLPFIHHCQFIRLVTMSNPPPNFWLGSISISLLTLKACELRHSASLPGPHRTACGPPQLPTQIVTESFSPQAVPMVTAAASHGIQTIEESAGSLCLRTWDRGTSSALVTDKVTRDFYIHRLHSHVSIPSVL